MEALLLTLCRVTPCTAFLFSARRPGAKAPVAAAVESKIPAGDRRPVKKAKENGNGIKGKADLFQALPPD